jgi:hypothetical protein
MLFLSSFAAAAISFIFADAFAALRCPLIASRLDY